jgi:hypothetical protein
MFRKAITLCLLLVMVGKVQASGKDLEIKDIFYCGEDFSMAMSNGERWVVRKAEVGADKFNHFMSMAMFMVASGKKTGNVFPGDPIPNWCGNSNVRPITIFSFKN